MFLSRYSLVLSLGYLSLLISLMPAKCDDSPDGSYVWPLKGYYAISSSFGEYRPGHIHMGIDIRTPGITGVPVKAVDDGYIWRIKVKYSGYGRALYLRMSDGRMAVYAHLKSFAPDIEEYLLERQWGNKSFTQDLYPSTEHFRYKKGDIIAYSGRSGTKHPHLHFEIRNSSNECLNALSQGFSIDDNKPPVIKSLGIIPLSSEAEVNGDCQPQVFRAVHKEKGKYSIEEIPRVYGHTGLAVLCYDLTDGAPNPITIYRLELKLDGETKFDIQYDYCDFDSYQSIEIDRDAYLNGQGAGRFQRLFRAPGNTMPFYNGEGRIDCGDMGVGPHSFTVRAEDYYGNSSILSGEFEIIKALTILEPEVIDAFSIRANGGAGTISASYSLEFFHDWVRIEAAEGVNSMSWDGGAEYRIVFSLKGKSQIGRIPFNPEMEGFNYLICGDGFVLESWYVERIDKESGGVLVSPDGDFRVIFKPDGIYEEMYAEVKSVDVSGIEGDYELGVNKGYHLEPQWIPLQRPASLEWTAEDSCSQLGIYFLDGDNKPIFLGNRRDSTTVIAECLNLETFVLLYDRAPPEVEMIHPCRNAPIRQRKPEFHFSLDDTLSGIDGGSVMITIDDEWILTEYDPPVKKAYGYLRYPLRPGEHKVIIKAADRCGNETSESYIIKVEG